MESAMKHFLRCGVAFVGLFLPAAAGSHSADPAPVGPRCHVVAMLGEFIDPMCYCMHDARGPDHAACAEMCARGGQTLAFLDMTTGNVYPLIAAAHGQNPNDGLYKLLGKSVDMRGALYSKGGTTFLQVTSATSAVPTR